ncbi:response regulator [Hahella sp. KA22]|uniref:response regulator transcription factor n=1 Tax=Hahella sp. KA22 TaxID=1628392 RepID=UPI000FDEB930|nr:response regulator transcription factor [Hahella sp. KA22]AZZ94827.1 response regulator transcription factor [Hahella sp. KA22]QAY58201.1 response regulator [Hahella sp. KA22]
MRILLVEDEALLRGQLRDELVKHGYAVDTAEDGEVAAYLGKENPYDLAVVDLGLPKRTGLEVIQEWRGMGKEFPILILTARGHWQDKVSGLEAGADDYLVKPFHVAELMARLGALLRRSSGFSSPVIQAGPMTLDTRAKLVQIDGTALELTAYEYNTLEYLVHRAGQAVSKTELTEHLYAQDFDRDSNVIEVFIGRLRKKLDPDGVNKPITTLRGQGYRFNWSPQKTA